MSEGLEKYVCTVCGQPATDCVRDSWETTRPWDTIDRYDFGDAIWHCDDHKVKSKNWKFKEWPVYELYEMGKGGD